MTFDDYERWFPRTRVTDPVRFACHYLEHRGYRFAVDFGTTNAIRKAADEMMNEIRYEEGYGV